MNILVCIVLMCLLLLSLAEARPLKAGVADLNNHSLFVTFSKQFQEEVGKENFTYELLPFARSIHEVTYKENDLHYPAMEPEKNKDSFPYDFSETSMGTVYFGIYYRTGTEVPMQDLNKLEIETDLALADFFAIKMSGTTCLECSLKKLANGRIDAIIYSSRVMDSFIQTYKIKNVSSMLYKTFPIKFILPKGQRGGETDKYLAKILERMKKNPLYRDTLKKLDEFHPNQKPLKGKS